MSHEFVSRLAERYPSARGDQRDRLAFPQFGVILGTGVGGGELQARLLNEAGVAVIAGTSFGAHGEGYLRFSYANSVDNISEATRRIRACLT